MRNKLSSGLSIDYLVPDNAPLDPKTGFAVNSGDGVLCGSFFGVASNSGIPGNLINLDLEGIFVMKKPSTVQFQCGQKLYFDKANNVMTADPTMPWVAVATADAPLGAENVEVRARLNGLSIDPTPART